MTRKTIKVYADKLVVFSPLTFRFGRDQAICDRLLHLPDNAKVAAVIRDMCRNGIGAVAIKEDEAEIDLSGLGKEL